MLSFLYIVLLVIPFISASDLRAKSLPADLKTLVQRHLGTGTHSDLKKVASKGIVGTFPEDPMYVSWMGYKDSTCNPEDLLFVSSFISDVCVANGTTSSERFSCDGNTTATRFTYLNGDCSGSPSVVTDYSASTCNDRTKLFGCTSDPYNYGVKENIVADSFFEGNGCYQNLLGTTGFIENVCSPFGTIASYEYAWPLLKVYAGNPDCAGSPSATFNLQLYGCSNTHDADNQPFGMDNTNIYLTASSYEKWSHVSGAKTTMITSSFGLLMTLFLVVMQLF